METLMFPTTSSCYRGPFCVCWLLAEAEGVSTCEKKKIKEVRHDVWVGVISSLTHFPVCGVCCFPAFCCCFAEREEAPNSGWALNCLSFGKMLPRTAVSHATLWCERCCRHCERGRRDIIGPLAPFAVYGDHLSSPFLYNFLERIRMLAVLSECVKVSLLNNYSQETSKVLSTPSAKFSRLRKK